MLFGGDITKPWIRTETPEKKKARARRVLRKLAKQYPDAKLALTFHNPLQLLVAVILSAQVTDKKVNEVTARLFRKYRTVEDYAEAAVRTFSQAIREIGFYRQKARAIIASARLIRDRFHGEVPRTMAEMLVLRGVARKTANIVLGGAYGVAEGIAVDRHVRRLAQRLGFSGEDDPAKIERDLMQLFPRTQWLHLPYVLITHGRTICTARNRKCLDCVVHTICPASLV